MIINVPKPLTFVAGMLTIGLGPGLSLAALATENDHGLWTVFTSTDSFQAGDGGAQVTPSAQPVENPGFDASGATLSSSAIVASVRFHWSFTK